MALAVFEAKQMRKSGWPRTPRAERGYGAQWDKIRLIVLRRDCGLCQCDECKAQGKLTAATEVNHIKPIAQGGDDSPENLQAVNHDCHERITAVQNGRSVKPRVSIGIDGYPA